MGWQLSSPCVSACLPYGARRNNGCTVSRAALAFYGLRRQFRDQVLPKEHSQDARTRNGTLCSLCVYPPNIPSVYTQPSNTPWTPGLTPYGVRRGGRHAPVSRLRGGLLSSGIREISILRRGSQGPAHAQNLKDTLQGTDVTVWVCAWGIPSHPGTM